MSAEANEKDGDFIDASNDLQQAENIFVTGLGENSAHYWSAVLLQAVLMKREGPNVRHDH